MSKRYRFYIGKGVENDRLISQLITIEQTVNLVSEKLFKEYGAQGLVINRKGKAVGLYFIERQEQPFLKADLFKADMRNVCLKKANLNGADLRKVSLNNARINGADFSNADLRGVKITNTNMSNMSK